MTIGPPPEYGRVLLAGIVGSTAYGLAGPDSDVDRLGVYACPTEALHDLRPPPDSWTRTGPDVTYHEARKYAQLALAGNPTVQELMWLPHALYEHANDLGVALVDIRSAFLSAKRVRDAYMGYATQQFRKLEARADGTFSADLRKRTAKHARHLLRLCHQGLRLYETGELEIRLADPDRFVEFGEYVAGGDVERARSLMAHYEARFDMARSPLPARPDEATVVRWLRRVRAAHYEPEML